MTYISNKDVMLEIARGNVSGMDHVNKFGKNGDVGTTDEEIWDGNLAYTWPTSASVTHIRAGTDSATTRGQTIEVQGLDTNWAIVTQTKDTDGTNSTTEVALDTALRRVFRMKVLENAVMDQPIWAGPTGFASQQAIIQTGNNQTLMALYTVPDGKTAYMTQYYATANPAGAGPANQFVSLWGRDNSNSYEKQLKHVRGLDLDGTSGFNHPFLPYYVFTQRTDIFITGRASGSGGDISAGFDIILVDN